MKIKWMLVGVVIGLALSSVPVLAQEAAWLVSDPQGNLYLVAHGQKQWVIPRQATVEDLEQIPSGPDLPDGSLLMNSVPDPVSFSGQTDRNTEPFALAGGHYRVQWTADPGRSTCAFYARLHALDGRYNESFASAMMAEQGRKQEVETFLYNVRSGSYYTEVSTNCVWQITILPY